MLFFCSIIFSAASHRLLATHASSQHLAVEDRGLSEAEEHQRILKELEEVHQLRERMLQQGKCITECFVHHHDDVCQALWSHLMPHLQPKLAASLLESNPFYGCEHNSSS